MKTEDEILQIAKAWYHDDHPQMMYSSGYLKNVPLNSSWEEVGGFLRQYYVNSVKKQLAICEKDQRNDFSRGGIVDAIRRGEVSVDDPHDEERLFQKDIYWNDRDGYPGDFGDS